MDTLLMMTVGSLLTLVGAVAGWGAFLAWHAGRLWSERRHREELATLRLQLRLANEDASDNVEFVDLARIHLSDEFAEVTR